MLCGLEDLWSPWIGISAPYPCDTALALPLALALALALWLALALPTNPLQHSLLTTSTTDVEKTKYVTVTQQQQHWRKNFLLAWLEAYEHRQEPGENGRRIEHFIGENEYFS